MTSRSPASSIAVPLAILLAACAIADAAPPPEAPMTVHQPKVAAAGSPDVQAMLPAVLDDAARRSGVAVERLRVDSVQSVTWPDGSLGCPQPGRLYTQALVPGWRIVIAPPGAAPQQYHAGQRGSWVWCPPERATPALPAEPDSRI